MVPHVLCIHRHTDTQRHAKKNLFRGVVVASRTLSVTYSTNHSPHRFAYDTPAMLAWFVRDMARCHNIVRNIGRVPPPSTVTGRYRRVRHHLSADTTFLFSRSHTTSKVVSLACVVYRVPCVCGWVRLLTKARVVVPIEHTLGSVSVAFIFNELRPAQMLFSSVQVQLILSVPVPMIWPFWTTQLTVSFSGYAR
jgi:hypothetical protein